MTRETQKAIDGKFFRLLPYPGCFEKHAPEGARRTHKREQTRICGTPVLDGYVLRSHVVRLEVRQITDIHNGSCFDLLLEW